jgi:DNA-binding PadR family transcriptional regulator
VLNGDHLFYPLVELLKVKVAGNSTTLPIPIPKIRYLLLTNMSLLLLDIYIEYIGNMKYLLLALIAKTPTHGYDLLQTYDELFSSALAALNAGQIYTTLQRLERDGLVKKHDIEQTGKPDKRIYELTDEGHQELSNWFAEPLRGPRIKDNFFLKLINAQISGLANPLQLIIEQRRHYLQTLHNLNDLALRPGMLGDASKSLLIQGAILHLKADLDWLEICEERFSQAKE